MALNKLSDTDLRYVKVGDGRLSDGGGLYLKPAENERELHGWRFDYSYQGKRRTISLGTYPAVGLAAARRKAEGYRTAVASGQDPSALRKAERLRCLSASRPSAA